MKCCSQNVFLIVMVPEGKILDMSVSLDGLLHSTTSEDKALKIFDVVNFGKPDPSFEVKNQRFYVRLEFLSL